jgi:hypothetical protein
VSCTLQRCVAQSILNRVDGTECEEEPEDVAVPESVEPVREPLVSLPGIKQQNQVGPEEKKKESKEEGESELEERKKEIKGGGERKKKKHVVVDVAVAGRAVCSSGSSSSGSIPIIYSPKKGGRDRGGNKLCAVKHKRISPSRGGKRSVLGSPSVSTCARYSSNSSPHHTVEKPVSLYTYNTNTNAGGPAARPTPHSLK